MLVNFVVEIAVTQLGAVCRAVHLRSSNKISIFQICRKGYALDRALIERGSSDEMEYQLPRAQVTSWTTGEDIIEKLKKKLNA